MWPTLTLLLLLGGSTMTGETKTMEPFFTALRATGPAADRADRMTLYAPLLGDWVVDVIDYADDGSRRTTRGEVHFAWVLEGRAIQDVWIVPARDDRRPGMPTLGNRYGTTLRIYDPEADVWHVTWFNPVTGVTNRLVGSRQGTEIMQVGTGADGVPFRWVFSDITAESFRWRGETSADGGKSWQLKAEFLGRRAGVASGAPR